MGENLLEVRPGIGTVVGPVPEPSSRARRKLLGRELERLAVEAKNLSLDLPEVVAALEDHWQELSDPEPREDEKRETPAHRGGR